MDIKRSFFTIGISELTCPQAYVVEGINTLRHGDSIIYDAGQQASIATDIIFYGPYFTLIPGVYLFEFNGQLDGDLLIDFADQEGTVILKKITLNNFRDPVCLAVTKTLTKFEVRGFKTPSLNGLKLDSISVETITIEQPLGKEE